MTTNHAAPWTFRRLIACLLGSQPTPRYKAARPGITHVLSGREAVARHLFGESVNWSDTDMAVYDRSPYLQGGWLAEADRRIEHAGSPDRHVAAHWGYTPAEWLALPGLVQVDKREQFFQAQGLAS